MEGWLTDPEMGRDSSGGGASGNKEGHLLSVLGWLDPSEGAMLVQGTMSHKSQWMITGVDHTF